ncbi:thermoresistant glucokinase family carbohydrate kinase [Allomyces macrogynus ATCC 38327]|uniref:Gluconokinase n=1 Tax=Allomyces macrogynus (strain ATCC 38327) TaxID=578462 RepID=A0A0L0SP06_ALLM3|nr:thermoresistant glucokinase family carbohydrate kinase [Allomyces macrogynus ATCC 38327]|eukprot:KNE64227.1 thermoresistant glucokinase family carbohydrate kinase [Allomyces macrogynus ATCC 38327]
MDNFNSKHLSAQIPQVVIMMGVSGSGKSTIMKHLVSSWRPSSSSTPAVPIEGDDLHPAANVAKMRSGTPLTDVDRMPWLDAVATEIIRVRSMGTAVVVTCSALRRVYRAHLAISAAPIELCFVYMDMPERELQARLEKRAGHYMPARLLASQLATLEVPDPTVETEYRVVGVPVAPEMGPGDVAAAVAKAIGWIRVNQVD